jgi:hypothetical protein
MAADNHGVTWVVYRMALPKSPDGMNVVCEQREWDDLQQRQPGLHQLVKAGIASEAEAERLARGTSGDALRGGRRDKQA